VVVTRVYRNGRQQLAAGDIKLAVGDILHAVGTERRLEAFRTIVGRESEIELPRLRSPIAFRRVVVTKKELVGKTLEELDLAQRYGVIVTRVARSGVEFSATRGMRIQFGDRLVIVGLDTVLDRASRELGDSLKDLERPNVLPVFIGLVVGVLVGQIPIQFPHFPAPVRLGLAGGPLIVALLLGRFGKVGPVLAYLPNSAKDLLKEVGIALFLASVGLRAGQRFVSVLVSGNGFMWMGLGALVTFVTPFVAGVLLRMRVRMNFVSICGILAGSHTNPPSLAFATQMAKNDAPSIAYATVYPLATLLRVLIAQTVLLVALR